MDDALEAIEGGETLSGLLLEIGEDAVLDDRETMRLGEFEQAMGDRRRQRCTGGVMQGRIGDVEAWTMLGQVLAKGLNIGSRGRKGNAHDPGAMSAQHGEEIEIAGIIDEYGIAGFDEEAAQEIDRLGPRVGEQDLVGRGIDALIEEAARQKLPQGGEAQRLTVIGQIGIVLAPAQAAQPTAQRLLRHPGCRQPTAARLQHFLACLERLARDPERVDGAVEPGADLGQSERRHVARDVEARSTARGDGAVSDQAVIGLDYRRFGDAQRPGKGTNGGQLRSRRQQAAGDPLADRFHDMFDTGRGSGRSMIHLY